MATSFRRPLALRPSQPQQPPAPKRSRSPEPEDGVTAGSKRVRTTSTFDDGPDKDRPSRQAARERRIAEKEQQKAEFRDKYRRAFPSWTFYFDADHIEPDRAAVSPLDARIQGLGGTIEDFFSNQVTHLITNQPLPAERDAEKENVPKSKTLLTKPGHSFRSPMKLKSRDETLTGSGFDLVSKALSFGIKVWTTSKLDSVLNRCLDLPDDPLIGRISPTTQPITNPQRSLTRLLQSERIYGISERDPTQKRHDFHYFSKSSYFILVEDLRQELATIAAHEYEVPKSRDGKTAWPVLYCHPCARGPFIPFDEKEKKRWERQQQVENNREEENNRKRIRNMQGLTRKADANMHSKKSRDLRRSISLCNLHRRASYPLPGPQEGCLIDGDPLESNNASGYLASAAGTTYIAASGNSISIASTTGTTSTAGYPLRNTQLSSALSGRIRQQVLTSRRLSIPTEKIDSGLRNGQMGPPEKVPARQAVLRKSKSTNTLRLPKRDEGSKPGYCESCRVKFDDFKLHTSSRKHKKFATDDANFLQLDCVLARVQRRTVQQLDAERAQRLEQRQYRHVEDENTVMHCRV